MQRKLVQLGSTTLMVAIPSRWIKANNLSKGDAVTVSMKDDDVVVSSSKKDARPSITINLPRGKDFMKRLLVVPYIKGYDEIVCVCPDALAMERASDFVESLIGIEVIDQRHDRLFIKNIASEREEEFKPIFRRAWYLLLSMLEDGHRALVDNDTEMRKQVARTDVLIEKYIRYCMRVINKKGHQPPEESYLANMMLYAMENSADSLRILLNDTRTRITKAEAEYLVRLAAAVRACHDAYYDRDVKKLIAIKEQFRQLYIRLSRISTGKAKTALIWITEQFYQLSHLIA